MKNYDFIATDKSVNRTAGMVVKKGIHYDERTRQENYYISKIPLPIIPFIGHKEHDLTGNKYYRLRVIGYIGKGSRTGRWLVRCTCGNYEVRLAKVLKRKEEEYGKCSHCQDLDYIKSEEYRDRFLKKIKE